MIRNPVTENMETIAQILGNFASLMEMDKEELSKEMIKLHHSVCYIGENCDDHLLKATLIEQIFEAYKQWECKGKQFVKSLILRIIKDYAEICSPMLDDLLSKFLESQQPSQIYSLRL